MYELSIGNLGPDIRVPYCCDLFAVAGSSVGYGLCMQLASVTTTEVGLANGRGERGLGGAAS